MDDSGFDISYLEEIKQISQPKVAPKGSTSKKDEKKVGPSQSAINATLKKKELDAKIKAEEYKKSRENLLAMRAQDKTSYKKMKSMITRTKGYSKAVIEDCKDLTTARGELQCDDDDYGYESAMSQKIFEKLATQYSEIPDDERLKFKKIKTDNIEDVKSRVLNSLKRQQEEESGPRKRKRKESTEKDEFINDGDPYDIKKKKELEKREEEKKKSEVKLPVNINFTNHKTKDNEAFKYDYDKAKIKEKKKKPVSKPPSLNFMDLLKVAAEKQTDNVKKGNDMLKEKVKEREEIIKEVNKRPLTAREKEEQEEERLRKLRRQGKLPQLPIEKLKEMQRRKENKESGKTDDGKIADSSSKNSDSKLAKSSSDNSTKNNKSDTSSADKTKAKNSIDSKSKVKAAPEPEPKIRDRSKYFALPFGQGNSTAPKQSSSSSKSPASSTSNGKLNSNQPSSSQKSNKSVSLSKKEVVSSKSSSKPVSSKPVPSKPISKSRPFPPPDVRKPPVKPAKMRIESDSEYDSEMDDFIDDGDVEDDYSSQIQSIFGYNRNKYQDEDDDIDDMEVGFSQLEKEEKISAKIGELEDLEDMRMEEEERKKKLLKKKMKSRK